MLKCYDTDTMLHNKAQKYLLEEIFMKAHLAKWETGNKTCLIIANKIVKLFPSEELELYYVAPIATGDRQTHSKGMLPNKFRNARKTFVSDVIPESAIEKANFEMITEGKKI